MESTTKPLILVTGSSGLIGTRVIDDLAHDHRVVGMDVRAPEQRPDNSYFIECDLTGDDSVSRALEEIAREHGTRIASVIHLAAYYDFAGEPSPLYQDLTVEGTRRLLRGLNQRFTVEQFVFSSAVERRGALGDYEVFLIAEPEVATYGHLQDKLGALIHGEDEWTTLRMPAPLAKAGAWVKDKLSSEDAFIKPWMIDLADAHYPVSSAKAHAMLGWIPSHRLETTLVDMVHHLKADPDAFYRENGLPD